LPSSASSASRSPSFNCTPPCRSLGAAERAAHLQAVGKRGHGAQFIFQAPAMQDARHVGAQLDAGADLAERFGTLEQAHLPAGARHRQRRRQAANAATGDQGLLG